MTKFVTLIALLALSMLVIVPASAVNEYRDMNPANDVPDMSTYGYAQFYINAGGSAQDLTVYLQNVKQNLTFDSRWNPDRNDIEGQNGEWTKIQILPDGKSEKVLLTSGETFEACLRNGNGNQPECKRFIVGGADTTAVVFQGAAVTVAKVCLREIVSAEYCGETGGCAPEATSAVRKALSKGHLSFVFSNGWLGNYEGGIFDNEQNKNLLSPIEDPARGIVKHVSITYKDCSGTVKTIEAKEYEVINLT